MTKSISRVLGKMTLIAFLFFTAHDLQAQIPDGGRWRIALDGGWSYRLAKTETDADPQVQSYENSLKSGVNYGGSVMYYFNNLGVGARYRRFTKSINISGDNSLDGTSSIKDGIDFYAGSFGGRFYGPNGKGAFLFSVSVGYMKYTEKLVVQGADVKIYGGTVGGETEIGYDYHLSDHIAIGAKLGFLRGTLGRYTAEGPGGTQSSSLDDDNKVNLARLDLSGGIRFIL